MQMCRHTLLFVFLFVAVVSLHVLSGAAHAQIVSEIHVEGNQNWSTDRIILGFGVVIGEALSIESVRDGVRRLYEMGQFSDVQVYAEDKDDGTLSLIVSVVERPIVKSLKISGNDKVSDSDIEARLRIREGGPFDSNRLEESRIDVLRHYETKGFPAASVLPVVREKEGNAVSVELSIEEGVRVTVKKVFFEGNVSLDDKELKKVLETKEDRWWRTDAFYEREVLEDDFERVVDRYHQEGYIDAEVLGFDTAYDEEGEKVSITIRMSEGSLYHVASADWENASDFARDHLYELTKVKAGDVYKPTIADETIRDAYSWYGERGYIHARIYKREDIEPDNRVRVVFSVDEAEPAHIGEIHVVGNKRTKEKVVRRELTVKPGDLYRTSEVVASQRRVANLGFFEGPFVDFAESQDENDIDLVFTVEERPTGRAGVGVSHTSEKGFTGFLDVTEGNLFGNGHFLDFKWEFGKTNTEFIVGFTEPWFLDRHLSLGFDLYDTNDKRTYSLLPDDFYREAFPDDYGSIIGCEGDTCSSRYVIERDRRGGDVRIGWPFFGSYNTMMYVKYTLEQEKRSEFAEVRRDIADSTGLVVDTDTDEFFREEPLWKWRSGLTTTLVRRTTDRRFHPRSGSYSRLSADLFGGAFGGDVEYQRYILEARKYVPAFWRFTLMLRSRVGLVTAYGDPSSIPDDTRFEIGGVGLNGLRGYENRSILPEGNEVTGGRTMLIVATELKFPISEERFPIHGLLFAEAGNTWNSVDDTDPSSLYVGAGAGIRIEVPILGSIGVDMGYGFDEELGGDWIAHYQFGFDYW